jgi:hypothetical protein
MPFITETSNSETKPIAPDLPAVVAHPFISASLLLPLVVFGAMLLTAARYLAQVARF